MADIISLANQFIEFTKQNPIATGVLGSMVASVGYALREIPKKVWDFLSDRYVFTTITVNSSCDFYQVLQRELLPHLKSCNYRSFSVDRFRQTGSDELDEQLFPLQEDGHRRDVFGNTNKVNYRIVPGDGWFWFTHQGVLYFVKKRSSNPAEQNSNKGVVQLTENNLLAPTSTLTITAVSASGVKGLGFVRELFAKESIPSTQIRAHWHASYSWDDSIILQRKPLSTVVLNDGVQEHVLDVIDAFIKNKDEYQSTGTPYRLGLCFEGPSGTGKTSLVQALAWHYKRDVYLIRLGGVAGGNALMSMIASTSANAIIVFDDVDAQGINLRARSKHDLEVSKGGDDEKLKLADILNAVDGVLTPENRIFIYNTNMFNVFDSAFIRPGRMDHVIHLGPLEQPAQVRMANLFYPEQTDFTGVSTPVSPAELKKRLRSSTSAQHAQTLIEEYVNALQPTAGH